MIVSSLMLTRLTPTTAPVYLLVAYFLFGIGSGMVNPPITNTAVSGMPGSQAGVAAAIASTSRSVGLTLGVAVIGAIAGGTLSGAIEPSFAAATHAGWWVIAGPRRGQSGRGRADHHRSGRATPPAPPPSASARARGRAPGAPGARARHRHKNELDSTVDRARVAAR